MVCTCKKKKKKGIVLKNCSNAHAQGSIEIRIFINLILAISQPGKNYFNKAVYIEDGNISEGVFNKQAAHFNCQNKQW